MPAIAPTYSHGNNAADGTVVGAGKPIYIGDGTTSNPCMVVVCKVGTAIVALQGNGGAIDSTGNPPSDEWVDCSNGGYSLVPGQTLAKFLPLTLPFWRTYIVQNTGANVVSYVPGLRSTTGDFGPANRIPITGTQSFA